AKAEGFDVYVIRRAQARDHIDVEALSLRIQCGGAHAEVGRNTNHGHLTNAAGTQPFREKYLRTLLVGSSALRFRSCQRVREVAFKARVSGLVLTLVEPRLNLVGRKRRVRLRAGGSGNAVHRPGVLVVRLSPLWGEMPGRVDVPILRAHDDVVPV